MNRITAKLIGGGVKYDYKSIKQAQPRHLDNRVFR